MSILEKTVKIYETEGETVNFTAKVISCVKSGENEYEVILDRTAFFPGGGGQSPDTGTLNGHRIIRINEEGGRAVIKHIIDAPLEAGAYAEGCVDAEKRFSDMQNHTAEHIISGTVHRLYGYDNVGFHMGSDDITMDFNGILTKEQINEVEKLANEAVYADKPVKVRMLMPYELENITFRSKKSFTTEVRLVEIEGVDVCACCAPHVSHTGEIGIIKILDFQKYKGGTRVSMLAGRRAFCEISERYSQIKSLSAKLSSKPDGVCRRVEQLLDENRRLKYEKSSLYEKYCIMRAEELLSQCEETKAKGIIVFENNAAPNEIRILANTVKDKSLGRSGVLCAVFSKYEACEGRFRFAMACGDENRLLEAAETLKRNLKADCGGGSTVVQGSLWASEEEIRGALEAYVK